MKRVFVRLMILLSICVPAEASRSSGGPVELTLHPAKAPEPLHKYRLVLSPDELTDADAAPLYEKAIQSLPQDSQAHQKMTQWRTIPADQWPRQDVLSTLKKFEPALQLVEQAAKCRQCNWPAVAPGPATDEHMKELSKYRQLAFALEVRARLQIADSQYDQAVGTLRTGLAMGRHLGEGPTLVQGMVGISVAALSLRKVEEMIQVRDAPNLYWALQDVPKPPVDLTKTMELEMANLKNYNVLVRRQFEKQLEPAHERIRLQMSTLARQAAALQCVEALRLYAGAHDGKFPNRLSDITEVPVPDDPVEHKPFAYQRTGSKATLEAPAPKGAEARFAMQYVLNLTE
jgi:hypothetical protein